MTMTPAPTPAAQAGGPVRTGQDRPIIFSGSMVRALLDLRKTQTRRVLKNTAADEPCWEAVKGADGFWRFVADTPDLGGRITCRERYAVGDRLWVRENHAIVPRNAYRASEGVQQTQSPDDPDEAAIYAAGWERSKPRWRPSIHMPRWASRLTLIVTDVRVERLNAMSPADAIAEGIQDLRTPDHSDFGIPGLVNAQHPVRAFWLLWDSINGDGAWLRNPWVVAVTFEVHRANIDALPSTDTDTDPQIDPQAGTREGARHG